MNIFERVCQHKYAPMVMAIVTIVVMVVGLSTL